MRCSPRSVVILGLGFLLGACSTSTSSVSDGGAAPYDRSVPNSCLLAGPGFVCRSTPCGPAFVDMQDYFCGSTGDFCCAPVGDGGQDAANDVNVFKDGATFDAAQRDATLDAKGDATHTDAGHTDAPHADGGSDASRRDARHDGGAHADAGHDGGHADAEHDAAVDGHRG